MPMHGMKRWGAGTVLAAMLVLPAVSRAQAPGTVPVTAFVDVAVIPMDRERLLPHQTVVVQEGHITALGPTRKVHIPLGATRVDGRGKFLIPGLSDMHTHLSYAGPAHIERVLFLLFAAGVTTVRNVDYGPKEGRYSSNPTDTSAFLDGAALLRLRARAAAGALWSPRIYTSARWHTDSTKNVLENVAAYKAAGFDFIKIHGDGTGDRYITESDTIILDSLAVAAHRVGVPLVGHGFPRELGGLARSVAMGQRSIEHFFPPLFGNRNAAETGEEDWREDSLQLPATIATIMRAGIWNCDGSGLPYLTGTYPGKLERYRDAEGTLFTGSGGLNPWPAGKAPSSHGDSVTMRHFRYVLKALDDAGAGLLSGSDMLVFGAVTPGASALRDIQSWGHALTPYRALVIATRNVAKYFGTEDSTGTIAVGKRADLVLLDDNPLKDIRHVGETAGVMIGGRWMAWPDIEQRLQTYYAHAVKH